RLVRPGRLPRPTPDADEPVRVRTPITLPPRIDLATLLPASDRPWPLAELPSVQPHLDVAMAHDACTAEFARRHPKEPELRAYVALGNHDEAYAVGTQAMNDDPDPPPVAGCERLLAWSTLGTPELVVRLEAVPADAGACAKPAHAAGCAIAAAHREGDFGARLIAMRECFRELPDDPDREARLAILVVYQGWGEHPPNVWVAYAREAEIALGLRGAEELAIAAL